MKLISRYIYVDCPCGRHLIDLCEFKKLDKGFYTCNNCQRPLVCKGDDEKFYLIGEQL